MPVQSRPPKQLLLALLGDQVLDLPDQPVRAGAFIAALEGAGVAEPATRMALDRLARRGVLERRRRGREIEFALTADGVEMLGEAADRVRGSNPFHREPGWTLVTFSIPEGRRDLRHRLRAALTWEGFAPVRDGLWLAPGRVELVAALGHLADRLPEGAIAAFHAREIDGFPIAASVRQAWDIENIRATHRAFIDTWSDPRTVAEPGAALAASTMLVADWLALLRVDPGLPAAYMGEDWPAPESVALYQRLRAELAQPARAEFEDLTRSRAVAG